MSVLVTGGSRGIGAGILESLDSKSLRFGTCRPATLQRGGLDPQVEWIGVDWSEASAPLDVARQLKITAGFTELSGLVLNAGVALEETFQASEQAKLALDNIRINLMAPLELLHTLLAQGCVGAGASVVMIGSNLARHGLASKVSYAASKAGLEGATRALAKELGHLKIRVNTVAPGLIRTDMIKDMDTIALRGYAQEVPLGRVGRPADVASVVKFFLGTGSDYITGQVLDVDGGWGA